MTITPRKSTGRQYARLKTGDPARPYVRLSLKTKSPEEAKRKAKEANLKRIEAALQSGSINQAALARLSGRKVTTEQAARQWLSNLRRRGASEATIDKDRRVLDHWFAFVPAVRKLAPTSLTEEHVGPFINRTDEAGYATRIRQLSVLRVFFGYCIDLGLMRDNPAGKRRMNVDHRALSHKQREPRKRLPFTDEEIRHILASTEGWERWLTGISAATGMRLGDVCELEHDSLSVPGHIVVWTSKRDRRVCLPINETVTPGLAAILAEIPPSDPRYVFPEQARQYADIKNGRPKFSLYYGRLLKRLGLHGRSLHSLRHTAITRWNRIGFSLDLCADYAGHRSTKTTKGYIHA